MGRSYTYHVVGYGIKRNGKRYIYPAMNRLQIKQQLKSAAEEGDEIRYFVAQTRTGMRILNTDDPYAEVKPEDIPLPATITCPVCQGKGYYWENHTRYMCGPCRGSGITTKGELKKYMPWQLARMAAGSR